MLANVLVLVALWPLYKLVAEQFGDRTARWSLFFLAFSPFSITFAAGYAEALFVPLTLAVFLLVRRERWLLAGVLGAVATLTRPNGVLIVIVFAVALVHRFGWRRPGHPARARHQAQDRRRGRDRPARTAGLHGLPVGAVGRPARLHPLAARLLGPRPALAVGADLPGRRNVIRSNSPTNDTDSLWELLFLVLPLLALGLTWKRLPADYLLFTVAIFLLTVSMSSGPVEPLASIGRHLAGRVPGRRGLRPAVPENPMAAGAGGAEPGVLRIVHGLLRDRALDGVTRPAVFSRTPSPGARTAPRRGPPRR